MSRRGARRSAPLLLAAGLLSAPPASSHLVGGDVETRSTSDPAAEVTRRDAGPGRRWIAWRFSARRDMTVGCFSGWTRGKLADCGCSLAEVQRSWGSSDSFPATSGELEIYAAVKNGRVESLLLASQSCPVRADGERVTILENADPVRGVELLASIARSDGTGKTDEDLAEKALAAIAHHSAKEVPAASAAILRISRDAQDAAQRAHALFWLSQTDEPRAARWIREAIARDPDEEVREQGVFALSQLPDATDQLLALIRESRDRAVQKQALFWLGQSDDPKALAELERVLLHGDRF